MVDLTSEGIHVSSVVRCDGVQVNAAATFPLNVVALLTCATNRRHISLYINIY